MSKQPLHARLPGLLRTYRKTNGVNQGELAHILGCSRTYLSKLESGVYFPGAETAIRLGRLLSIPASEWLQGMVDWYDYRRAHGAKKDMRPEVG